MSTTEQIINSVTESTANAENNNSKIKSKDPVKKLKNLILLFGFALILSLLAIMIMYFMMSGNATKVKDLNERVSALTAQLTSKTDLADKSTTLEQQLKKSNDELIAQTKTLDEAANKVSKSEAELKSFKDKMTALETSNNTLATANTNLKATNSDLQNRIQSIKTSLGN
jgi:septal ring factor EnvC (AmiA/AmiB activator)